MTTTTDINDGLIEKYEGITDLGNGMPLVSMDEIGRIVSALKLAKAMVNRHDPHGDREITKEQRHRGLICGDDYSPRCTVCVHLAGAMGVVIS